MRRADLLYQLRMPMTEQPDHQPSVVTLDGEAFMEALNSFADNITELVTHVAAMDARLNALEQRGKGKRKGFEP